MAAVVLRLGGQSSGAAGQDLTLQHWLPMIVGEVSYLFAAGKALV
jgi:hypothetical protein